MNYKKRLKEKRRIKTRLIMFHTIPLNFGEIIIVYELESLIFVKLDVSVLYIIYPSFSCGLGCMPKRQKE